MLPSGLVDRVHTIHNVLRLDNGVEVSILVGDIVVRRVG